MYLASQLCVTDGLKDKSLLWKPHRCICIFEKDDVVQKLGQSRATFFFLWSMHSVWLWILNFSVSTHSLSWISTVAYILGLKHNIGPCAHNLFLIIVSCSAKRQYLLTRVWGNMENTCITLISPDGMLVNGGQHEKSLK